MTGETPDSTQEETPGSSEEETASSTEGEVDPESLIRAYYEALDTHDYERLETLLAPSFTQHRPDLTLDGREEFIAFMRDERPDSDTRHPIEAVYRGPGGAVAARGRLLTAEGEEITGFVDVFRLDAGRIHTLQTYTD